MLDVRRLRLLREVQLRGTIAAVAAALHQSPSSVSQQLTQLEREVGQELLRKAGRRVQLTTAAEILVEHTAVILDRLERAEADVLGAAQDVRGTVRLAIFQSAMLALMPGTLRELREQHPALRVTITQREPETALLETFARDFDLVVAEQYPGHTAPWHGDLDRVPLTRDGLRLAVPGRWPEVRTIADAAALPWVLEPFGAASRHFVEQACRTAGFDPDVRFETADLQAHVALLRSGDAVAVMPDLMWQGAEPPVRMVDLARRPRRTVFTAVRRSSVAQPSIVAVRAALASAVGSLGQATTTR